MKVAIDLTSLADNFSGIERHAAELSYSLLEIDKSNTYVLVFKESVHPLFSKSDLLTRANVKVEVLPRGEHGKLYFSQIILPRELKRIGAELAVFLAFPAPVLYTGRAVSTIHDLCWHDAPETMLLKSRLYWEFLEKVNARRNVKILTISQFSKQRIVDVLHVPESKVVVTYCGVDSKLFNREKAEVVSLDALKVKYEIPDSYVLTLSTIEPRKNIGLLVDAWVRACQEDGYAPDLVLAGRRGWKQEALIDNVPEQLKERVHFTGFVGDDDLPSLFANSELFVFPSIYEGFGLPPIEAASCGARVLCSDIPCLKEICGEGVKYFKSGDVSDLKRALISANENDAVLPAIREYSWLDSAKTLIDGIVDGI